MLRVTADTNVFISALNFRGKPLDIWQLARADKIELAISDDIMTELKRVLSLKFKWPDDDIVAVEKQITSFTRHVDQQDSVDIVKEDRLISGSLNARLPASQIV